MSDSAAQRRSETRRSSFRSIFFWLHLCAGVAAGVVIFVMAVTGALLAYEQRIVNAVDARHRSDVAGAESPRSLETVAASALEIVGGEAALDIEVKADPAEPVTARVGRERVLFLDARSGRMLGEGSQTIRQVFAAITGIHRWLGASGEHRQTARAATGAANLAFLVLVLSGLYLWLPRRWTFRQVRNVAWFRRGLSGKARDFNWHNTIGLWTALPLVVIVASGVVMSYRWANDLVYRVSGDEPPAPRERSREPRAPGDRRGEHSEATRADLEGLDELLAVAERQVPAWQTIGLRLPLPAEGPVELRIAWGPRGRPDQRGQLAVDRASGAVTSWKTLSDESTGRRARSWLRWLHTGEAGGFLGETLAGIASAGAAVLVWTGLFLAWRRFFPRRRPRGAEAAKRASEPASIESDPLSELQD